MHMRQATNALLLALLACAGPASGEAPAERGFIERSLLLAPKAVGDFSLANANDYPGNPASGAGFRYVHPDFPEVRIDLFVYPIGREVRDTAVARGIAEVRASVEDAVAQGSYSDLVFGDEVAFDLRRVDVDGDLLPAAALPEPPAGEDHDAQLLRAIAEVENAVEPAIGRRLDMQLKMGGSHQNSRGFLFYRGLYLYKGRISAPPTLLPGEAFDRFTNHAMALLVPAIQVRSTGACHASIIYVDPDKEDTVDFIRQSTRAQLRKELEQCDESLDESVPDGFRAIALEFDPAMWQGPPRPASTKNRRGRPAS